MAYSIFPQFFEGNYYFIDEKVNFLKFENAYKVYNQEGLQIGKVVQKLTAGQKMLRLLLNKAMLPFSLQIQNMDGEVQATIIRGWTFWMSKITIMDGAGLTVGSIKQKFKMFRPKFLISDASDNQVAEISGDWKAWNFSIKDPSANEIGTISKKWAGVMKEIFTTADKYLVTIMPEYAEDSRKIAIVAAAITIDMVLKESK